MQSLLRRYFRGDGGLSEIEAFLLKREQESQDLRFQHETRSSKLDKILEEEERKASLLRVELEQRRDEAEKAAKIRAAKLEQERLYDSLTDYGVKRFRLKWKTVGLLVGILIFIVFMFWGC